MGNLLRKRRRRGRVVVITGASAGIGRATAQELAQQGARIGLLARGRERLESTRREVERLGGRALVIPTDVSDAGAVDRAAGLVEEELGPIDVWINNAMVTVYGPVGQIRAEEFERVTRVTYLGYVHGTLAALRRMVPRDRGVIVQVGSALAYRSLPLQAAYSAAKHAILGFTGALRTELLHDRSRVRVTMVQLPAHNTPQFEWARSRMSHRPRPVPPIYEPEVAARAIAWAVDHPQRRELVVGWPALQAIWGHKLFPGLADRYLAKRGYEAQLTEVAEDPNRPENLFSPVPGDFRAHGPFEQQARERTTQVWLAKHRWLTAAAAAGVAGVAVVSALRS